MNSKHRMEGNKGGDGMVKEDWVCYWQSDASPKPVIQLKKTTTHKDATAWLKAQKPTDHWTPNIAKKATKKEALKAKLEEDS